METIGGYRIIRKLGSGERSDVYLGHAAPRADEQAGLAAIKLFRPGVSEDSINAEVAALSRLQHAHIVSLLDLATGPRDGPCLVLERLGPRGLPALLAERRGLHLGEVVTILAPVIAAVAAMHGDGVSHGAISARKIHFDDAGAPVIMGFGAAASFAASGAALPEAVLESEPLVVGDRTALLKLVKTVMGRSSGSNEPVAEISHWLASRVDGNVSLTELEQRIFQLAEPLAVQFADPLDSMNSRDPSVPSRLLHPGELTDLTRQAHQGSNPEADASCTVPSLEKGRAAELLSVLPPEIAAWLSVRLTGTAEWVTTRTSALRDQLGSVRKGVWLVAAIGVTTVAITGVVAGLPSTTDSVASTPRTETPPPVLSPAVAGDDPITAVGELLQLRERCLHDRSILCLDSVHAADSAAWRADAERIRSVQDGAELGTDPFPSGSTATLVDRLGHTALLELVTDVGASSRTTASVLVIKTEAGWRFRSVVTDSAPVDGSLP